MLAVTIAVQACSSTITDIGGMPTAPSFTVTSGSATVSLASGGTAKTFIKARRAGGLTSAITYAAIGARAGLTAIVASTEVADSSTLTITATGRPRRGHVSDRRECGGGRRAITTDGY
jgi:hypothetical protein